jgi:dihydrofolate reductase
VRKLVAGLAMTLDGVVESPSANWMRFDREVEEVIAAGIASADAIVLGRRTYLQFAELWPKLAGTSPMADFMNGAPKYIASRTLSEVAWANSTLISGDLATTIRVLKDQPGKNIQVPGSPALVRVLLRDGLLDELALMVHPIVLGQGARLFEHLSERIDLELSASQSLTSGIVVLSYHRA